MVMQEVPAPDAEKAVMPVLSWPAAKFRAALRSALVAASTSVEKPQLCAVQVARTNGVLTVTATDGYWLFRWTETEGQTDEAGDPVDRSPFQCLIPRRALESFLDATKKPVELERVLLSRDGGARWQLETIFDVCKHEFFQVAETFPPVENVIPSVVAPTCSSIGVGANLIAKVAKAFALATSKPEATIFWQLSGDALSPLVCTSPDHGELLAVVMPRRVTDDANAVPEEAGRSEGGPTR